MVDLKWYDIFEIGVDFIDEDHKKLLNIMLDVKNAVEANNHSKCTVLLNKLLQEARAHFAREEAYLAEARYPGLESHKAYHKALLVKADTTKRICEGLDTDNDLKECFDGMANFLIDDILHGDLNFKSHLDYIGYLKKR